MGGALECRKGKIGLTDVGSVSRWSQPTISRFAGRAIEELLEGLAPLADHDFRAPKAPGLDLHEGMWRPISPTRRGPMPGSSVDQQKARSDASIPLGTMPTRRLT